MRMGAAPSQLAARIPGICRTVRRHPILCGRPCHARPPQPALDAPLAAQAHLAAQCAPRPKQVLCPLPDVRLHHTWQPAWRGSSRQLWQLCRQQVGAHRQQPAGAEALQCSTVLWLLRLRQQARVLKQELAEGGINSSRRCSQGHVAALAGVLSRRLSRRQRWRRQRRQVVACSRGPCATAAALASRLEHSHQRLAVREQVGGLRHREPLGHVSGWLQTGRRLGHQTPSTVAAIDRCIADTAVHSLTDAALENLAMGEMQQSAQNSFRRCNASFARRPLGQAPCSAGPKVSATPPSLPTPTVFGPT